MIKKMKTQLFYGLVDIRYEETDFPVTGLGEALVKIKSALTCSSDLKTYKRGHPTMIVKCKQIWKNVMEYYLLTIKSSL